MKKMLNLAVMLLGVALFTACENDDVENHGTEQVWVNSGVYVVCSGSQSSGINSALTYFEYATLFVPVFFSHIEVKVVTVLSHLQHI